MTSSTVQENQRQVEYRRLGKSGLRVSVPILGAMSFGSDKWAQWVLNEDKVGCALVNFNQGDILTATNALS
jgi:hypothetical protein